MSECSGPPRPTRPKFTNVDSEVFFFCKKDHIFAFEVLERWHGFMAETSKLLQMDEPLRWRIPPQRAVPCTAEVPQVESRFVLYGVEAENPQGVSSHFLESLSSFILFLNLIGK